MALGGGTFVSQNKILPGSYINFISTSAIPSTLGERGTVGMGLNLDWGKDDELFELSHLDFKTKTKEILGYDYNHEKMKGLRDLFKNVNTLIAYKLTSGGTKAVNEFATALYTGTRGNDLKIQIQKSVDVLDEFIVTTLLDNSPVDEQVVSKMDQLVPNDFVTFKVDGTLAEQAGVPLSTGTNGTIDGESHSSFLNKLESQSINVVTVLSEDTTINNLYAAYTERMRDERGQKFQAVLFNTPADYEGVVNVKNEVLDDVNKSSLVYWVAGVVAAKGVNESALNDEYTGEYDVAVEYTQTELEQAIKAGEFTLHRVGADIRVLSDINSLVTLSANKGTVFQDNQSIRVIDQIANDIARIFANKYLGVVPNDKSGRVSLQSDIISHHEELQEIRAIENFSEEDITVEQGDTKKSVVVTDAVNIVNTMEKLYMTVVIA